jgi:Ser/Thr protein kinase RdoA (MazF antagonist)
MNYLARDRMLSTAMKALGEYFGEPFPIARVAGRYKLGGGNSASPAYLLRTDRGYFTIKAYEGETAQRTPVIAEVENHLHASGHPVPQVVAQKSLEDGSLLLVRRFNEDGKHLPYLNRDAAEHLGESLARCHIDLQALIQRRPELIAPLDYPHEYEFRRQPLYRSIPRSALIAAYSGSPLNAVRNTRSILSHQGQTSLPMVLNHCDLHMKNILFTPEGAPILLDWDSMRYRPRVEDVARTMALAAFRGSAHAGVPNHQAFTAADGLLAGYHRIHPLYPEEVRTLPDLMRYHTLIKLSGKELVMQPHLGHWLRMTDDYLGQRDLHALLGVATPSSAWVRHVSQRAGNHPVSHKNGYQR